MKPSNVITHQHWFYDNKEENRADICELADGSVVVWFVKPDITFVAPSWLDAARLLIYLDFSREHPEKVTP